MHKSLFLVTLMVHLSGFVSLPAQVPVDTTFKRYKVTHFGTSDGLPGNSLLAVCQDSLGFLWMGGFEGLTRFDGSQFVVFNPQNTSTFESAQVTSVKADGPRLWIGTGRGLVKYDHGTLSNLSTPEFTSYIECLAFDEKRECLWLGTRNAGLIKYNIRLNQYALTESKFSHDIITSIAIETDGSLWISSEKNGVAHYQQEKWTYYSKSDGLPSNEITSLHLQGRKLYIGTILGLVTMQNGKIESVEALGDNRITKIRADPANNIWVLTTAGVHVLYQHGAHRLITRQHGLSANDIRDVCFDSDGSAWLATYRGGLNQLHAEKFVTLSHNEGLDAEAVTSIYQLSAQQMIVGTSDGKVFSLENRRAKAFPIRFKINKPICEILKDQLGNLWFATYDGLLLHQANGNQQLFTEGDGLPTRQLRSIVQTANGDYWIGSRTSGIIKMTFNTITRKPVFTKVFEEQLTQSNATFVISMIASGNNDLLIASSTGNVLKLSTDGIFKSYRVVRQGSSEVAFSARVDKSGVLWAASANGLSRIKDDSVVLFSKNEGLPQETIYDVMDDDHGNLWMPTTRGIIKVNKKELEDHVQNRTVKIHWRLYDKSDELIQSECTGASRIVKDTRGNLWFPMSESVVTVNPTEISYNSKPPGIVINAMFADDKVVSLNQKIILPPGSNRLVISYGAVSLKYQKAVHFKYKLENFDPQWIETESETQAVYTNLPPGRYIFRTTACNKDEVCNSIDANLAFTIEPYFYQTRWFYIVTILLLAASVFTYIRLRTQSIRHRAFELQQLVKIRTHEIASQRDELMTLNEELNSSQEEITAQRDALTEKNKQIEIMNQNLETIVTERTHVLEDQNKKLADYAFINAHQLRAPLASILGIIHLLEIETDEESKKKLLSLLHTSSKELDQVIRSINKMLE